MPPLPRAFIALVLLAGALTATLSAQDALGPPPPGASPDRQRIEVRLLTGARVAGELVREDDEQIVLEVGGVNIIVAKGRIARIDRLPSVEAQYRANRRLIGDHDVGQLLRLVDWLIEQDRLHIALEELDAILGRAPGHLEAAQTRVHVQAKLDLKRRKADPDAARREPPVDPFPLLDEDQVNLLKVYEVDLANPPRMLIEKDTIRRLIAAFADDPRIPQTPEGREALLSRRPPEILALMYELQARDFYGEVRVLDMPLAFKRFRQDVHGWLLNRCATPRCHGGADAGRLQLANPPFRANRDEVMLTNFLIIERFRTSDDKPLIDYDRPERSPLIHLAVMRENSLYPHAAVPGPAGRGDLWSQQFRTERDPGALHTQAWVRSMYLPRPDYPIDYTPPQGAPPAPARVPGPPR
jgi:hypothetical protein